MAAEAVQVVPYHPDFRAGILRLQQQLWGANDARNDAYLRWKYETNPYLSAPLVYVATFEGQPVGMRGMMGSCWEAAGLDRPCLLLCAGDLVIAPDYRRRGLFPKMMQRIREDVAARGIPYFLSLSGSRATRLLSLQAGWRSAGPLLQFRRPGRFIFRWIGRPFRRLDKTAGVEPAREGVRVTSSPEPEGMVELVARLGWDGRMRHIRDVRYLTWRFNNPRAAYRFCYLGEGRLQAYLVLHTRLGQSNDVVRIVDWEGDTVDARRKVLTALRFIDTEVHLHRSFLSVADGQLLRDAGFVEKLQSGSVTGGHSAILVRRLATAGEPQRWFLGELDLLTRESWDYRELYSDGV